jgi:hypothetical protein
LTKAEIGRLMRMAAALEETIQLLEREGDKCETIRRLRLLRAEILATVRLLEGDFPAIG